MRKMIASALCLMMAVGLCGCEKHIKGADDGKRFDGITNSMGEVLIVDRQTGVTYLCVYTSYGCGMTVLLDSDGKPLLAEKED